MDRKAADDEYDEYYVGDDGSYEQIERKGRWAPYLVFVAGTTGGACVKKNCPV